MVVDVALYAFVHQPRRLKLPAQPIPRFASIEDITRCLFDERLNEYTFRQVARSSYYPGAQALLHLVREQGLHLALGFSLSFAYQARRWEPALLDLFRELAAEEGVEVVGADPFQSLHSLIDLPAFAQRMNWMAGEIEDIFGQRPSVTDTTGMCMSANIYDALETAGFRGTFVDGDARIMQWRSCNYLYHHREEQAAPLALTPPARARRSPAQGKTKGQSAAAARESVCQASLFLLARHQELSAAINRHFSENAWHGHPVYADAYAGRIARTEGDFAFIHWDFESLGAHHTAESGIFDFVRALPAELQRHGVSTRTPSFLIERYAGERAYHLPLPVHPPAWSETLGLASASFYEPRREFFQLLCDMYNLARLTEQPGLLDLAIWLAQADNFSHLQEPAPGVPCAWWKPGSADYLREQKQVCLNVLSALEPYLPSRLQRPSRRKSASSQASPKRAKA